VSKGSLYGIRPDQIPPKCWRWSNLIKTHTGTLAKDLAEGDASIKTLTARLAKDLAEVDANTKTLTGTLAKDKDTMPCEYLSLEALEKWIAFGLRLCHTFLSHEDAKELWSLALNSSGTTVIHRDEVTHTHSYVQTHLESIKGYGKKVTEVKEHYAEALATTAANHRKRRKFLRTALKELVLSGSDQPGLLGPGDTAGKGLGNGGSRSQTRTSDQMTGTRGAQFYSHG
jgi:hypothetical protein